MHCDPKICISLVFGEFFVKNSSEELRNDGHILGNVGCNLYLFPHMPVPSVGRRWRGGDWDN